MPYDLPPEIKLPNTGLGGQLAQGLMQGLQGILAKNTQKQQNVQLGQLLGLAPEQQEQMGGLGADQLKYYMEQQLQSSKNQAVIQAAQQKQLMKNQPKKFITDETREDLKNVMKRQLEIMKNDYVGFGPSKYLFEKGRTDKSEFNTLSSRIEAALMPLVSKGTLATDRFNYILKLLPNASDTHGTIKGKMKALSNEFGIELPELSDTEEKVIPKSSQNERKSLEEIFR